MRSYKSGIHDNVVPSVLVVWMTCFQCALAAETWLPQICQDILLDNLLVREVRARNCSMGSPCVTSQSPQYKRWVCVPRNTRSLLTNTCTAGKVFGIVHSIRTPILQALCLGKKQNLFKIHFYLRPGGARRQLCHYRRC